MFKNLIFGSALIIISSISTLYISEFLYFVIKDHETRALEVWPAKTYYILAQKLGIKNFSLKTPHDLFQETNKDGEIVLMPAIVPSYFMPDDHPMLIKGKRIYPLSGIPNQRTLYCNEAGQYLIYDSDQLGFNNPGEVLNRPIDMMLIGDSFTHGACESSNHSIAYFLREKSQKNVFNAGMGGNGPLLELASMMEYGPRLKPKYVIWFYYEGNDVSDLVNNELPEKELLKYLTIDHYTQNLQALNQEIVSLQIAEGKRVMKTMAHNAKSKDFLPAILALKRENLAHIFELRTIRKRLGLIPDLITVNAPDNFLPTEFSEIIFKAKKEAATWGGEVIFVYLPEWSSVLKGKSRTTQTEVFKAALELKLKNVDMMSTFLRKEDPLRIFNYKAYGHYNAEGYELVADKVLELLSDHH